MNVLTTCLITACLSILPIIDGVIGPDEWADATPIGPLYQAGNSTKPVMAELSLGYIDGKLYGLVTGVDGYQVYACDPDDEYWLKLDGVTHELTDRAFVNEADCLADGMEFAVPVEQGDYTLVAHSNFDEARDTGQTLEQEIRIYCPPTAVLGSITNVSARFTQPGRVMLRWTQDTIADFTLIARNGDGIIGAVNCQSECVFVDDAAPAKAAYSLILAVGRLSNTFGPYTARWSVFVPLVPMGRAW